MTEDLQKAIAWTAQRAVDLERIAALFEGAPIADDFRAQAAHLRALLAALAPAA